MTNCRTVCLLFIVFFCSSDLSLARQLPKECNAGPSYWCESLKNAADCGAVGHCIGTVWETQNINVVKNDISDKFVKLFRELKDVKDLINEDYLSARITSACHDLQDGEPSQLCRDNTVHLTTYLSHVLESKTSPETMCRIVGMCDAVKHDAANDSHKKQIVDPERPKHHSPVKDQPLLGSERCTWGPSYWCSNITTGHQCKATHHCIERVWSKMQVKEDTDSICKICTDMVKQARDQLESNQTQEELKEVFEGSCKLIPIKLVAKECMNLADEFVVDLVETLASEMNPQTVCSVAGLCNNAKIDEMLVQYEVDLKKRSGCNNCRHTVGVLRARFDETSYDQFLVGMLKACRGLSSFSDSCSMLVFKYYENILELVRQDWTPKSMCHLSGQCTHMFHTHSEFTFPEQHKEFKASDDVPCEFCEQLVVHLRDVIVANTTAVEFYKVLKGLCKQTGAFKTECLSIVEQYYPMIYNYLTSELKPQEICSLIGVCAPPKDVPVAPLMPLELTVKALPLASDKLIGAEETKINKAQVPAKHNNVRIMGEEPVPLPIERMFVNVPQNKATCSFCQYFLHYLQAEISDTRNEEKIKQAVEKACDHLPKSIEPECMQFVTEYGPSVIALLVQEIDPASVCPALGMCPQTGEVRRVTINENKSNCPLCLFAIEQLEQMVKNNRTQESIRHALDNLCTHLSQKLRSECVDFVDTYSKSVINMVASDLDPQRICVLLGLCQDNLRSTDPLSLKHSSFDKFFENPSLRGDRNNFIKSPQKSTKMEKEGDIATNEIPDNTANGRPLDHVVATAPKTICVVCEFVMKEIDEQIKDKNNEDDIKKIVHGVCKAMPKSVRGECDKFVEKYADLVISLLAQELEPDEVCRELKLCSPDKQAMEKIKAEILDCAVCETVAMVVKKVLINERADISVVHVIEKACGMMPARYVDRCHTMMEIYGTSMIHLIVDMSAKELCVEIGQCATSSGALLHMYKEKHRQH